MVEMPVYMYLDRTQVQSRGTVVPLVLVHNDVVANPAHAWNDVEGVHYHYPSKYQSKIKTGESFVYYRGVHRKDGKRGPAEYVGSGRIGDVWPDTCRERMEERRGTARSTTIVGSRSRSLRRSTASLWSGFRPTFGATAYG